MKVLHSLADYEPKILLAFGESLKGDRKFTDFLMTNQFQELAALSGAINSDTDALNWLLQSDFPEFGVLSNAIDGEDNADNLFHTLWYGNYKDYQGDDDEKNNTMWRMVKDFIRALGLDPDQETDESDLVGLEFSAELSFNDGMSTDDDGNPIKVGNPRNEIVRIV